MPCDKEGRNDMKSKKLKNNRKYYNLLYILPLFVFMMAFMLVPFVTGIVKSLYKYDAISINEFIGLRNYIDLFTKDGKFIIALKNMVFLLFAMVFCFSFSVIAAKLTLMVKSKKKQYLFRVLLFLPMAIPSVVTMMMWKFLYYPEIGAFAHIFKWFGATFPNVLGTEKFVLWAIVLIGFPWISGFNYIIVTSALQGVDAGLIEGAKIDGTGFLKIFFRIELPLIAPQLKTLVTLALIGQIQEYERFLILTNGGPNNASLVPGLHMYKMAFSSGNSQYGYSCAISVILFLITLVFSIIIMRRKKES